MNTFSYKPSPCVPFRDMEVLERVRKIRREDIEKHPNPDFRIRVVPDGETGTIIMTDMLSRIKTAAETGERLVLILPNPSPGYRRIARLINALRLNCKNLYAFGMDEYANENGEIAPVTWPFGLIHAMMNYFYSEIDEDLRPPEKQFVGPTTENINDYGKMIEDMGGADMCYSGPGWTGHVAFIEPDAPEFDAPLEEWRRMGPRIVTLSPFTIAQNSLHGSFGMSGDLAAVPPKAATIGPAEVVGAKNRIETHGLGIHGTATSWQRLVSRLVTHGPVTPKVPSSIHQTLRTDCYISETIARNIEPDWNKGY